VPPSSSQRLCCPKRNRRSRRPTSASARATSSGCVALWRRLRRVFCTIIPLVSAKNYVARLYSSRLVWSSFVFGRNSKERVVVQSATPRVSQPLCQSFLGYKQF